MWNKRKTLQQILNDWKENEHIAYWYTIPERKAETFASRKRRIVMQRKRIACKKRSVVFQGNRLRK